MGYLIPSPPPRLNVDRHGLPRDYATYVWLLYRKHVQDDSPERVAFLNGPSAYERFLEGAYAHPDLGVQTMMR